MPFWRANILKKNPLSIYLLFLFILIQGCSNTQIGKELAASFDYPEQKNKPLSTDQDMNLGNKSKSRSNQKPLELIKKNGVGSELKNKIRFEKKKERRKVIVFKPQPYRITIKLSATNPSAPAETVTEALRQAGVSFEVEKIERIDNKFSVKESRTLRQIR